MTFGSPALGEPRADRSAASHYVSAALGLRLAWWARASELWTLSAAGFTVLTGHEKEIRPYLGRATHPVKRWTPLVHKRNDSISVPLGVSDVVRTLDTLATIWRRIEAGASPFWAQSLIDMFFSSSSAYQSLSQGLAPSEFAALRLAWWQAAMHLLQLGHFEHHHFGQKLRALEMARK